jgi:hypothetical protein
MINGINIPSLNYQFLLIFSVCYTLVDQAAERSHPPVIPVIYALFSAWKENANPVEAE